MAGLSYEIPVGQVFVLNGCPVRVVSATTKRVKLDFGYDTPGLDVDFRMLRPGEKFLTTAPKVE